MINFPSELMEEIRKHLEEQKTSITKRISELTKQDPFSNPDRLNDNAASDMEAGEESSHDRVEALILELNNNISEIDDALSRIGDGKYGFCKICGSMIDTDRLSILPTATLCLSCEKKQTK
jgi:RNA polymerase-binding transcription factor DksA